MNMKKSVEKRIQKLSKKTTRKISNFIGAFDKNAIKVFWFDEKRNFGDLLSPTLLKRYNFRPLYSKVHQADIVSIGSILHFVPSQYSGYIFGSGLIEDQSRNFPNANIIGVRGELTLKKIGGPKVAFLGDPGLLADRLLKKRREKKYLVGIVPHYVDKQDERIQKLSQKYHKEIKIIDVQNTSLTVIREIDECEYILSSSLHGLVVADSLDIPNGWLLISKKVIGNGFKFYDYWSAFETRYEPFELLGTEKPLELTKMTHMASKKIPIIKLSIEKAYIDLHRKLISEN